MDLSKNIYHPDKHQINSVRTDVMPIWMLDVLGLVGQPPDKSGGYRMIDVACASIKITTVNYDIQPNSLIIKPNQVS
jgi:hypothetical protein